MSKVLIDRAVLEATLEHAEFVSGAACEADDAIRAVLVAPSGTPELPVKAYYHEAPNEYGGLNKSVGLEVRKTFADAPLVLESDALAGFAARDARIAELEADRDSHQRCAIQAMAELAAIKAQEPESSPYGFRRIGWELERTAMGDGFYGNALRVAKDIPGITPEERSLLDRYATGNNKGMDHMRLQDLAMRIHWMEAPVAMLANAPAAPALPKDAIMVGRSELALVRNALALDCEQGRPIRGEMLAELDASIDRLDKLYAAPVSEAKAHGVVMLPSVTEVMNIVFDYQHNKNKNVTGTTNWAANIGMAVIDEIARLNAAPVMPEHPFCEYCGGNDEEPQDHCMDCTRPAQQVSVPDGWTAVSDRLPEVDQRLNQECRVGALSIAPLNVSAVVLVFDGEKVRSTRLEWFDDCLPFPYGITHWMPLPAAPAPGGE